MVQDEHVSRLDRPVHVQQPPYPSPPRTSRIGRSSIDSGFMTTSATGSCACGRLPPVAPAWLHKGSMPDVPCARWSGGGEAEVVAGCVEGGAELVGVAADLGEEEAALDAGHGG